MPLPGNIFIYFVIFLTIRALACLVYVSSCCAEGGDAGGNRTLVERTDHLATPYPKS
jgi:hypothetical protein